MAGNEEFGKGKRGFWEMGIEGKVGEREAKKKEAGGWRWGRGRNRKQERCVGGSRDGKGDRVEREGEGRVGAISKEKVRRERNKDQMKVGKVKSK